VCVCDPGFDTLCSSILVVAVGAQHGLVYWPLWLSQWIKS